MIKLVWERWPKPSGIWLRVQCGHDNGAITPTGLREEMLIPVQEWTVQHNCGQRMSFDLWRFDTELQVTAFLLRWT